MVKEYTVNSNLKISGDNTNEVKANYGPFVLKYESNEATKQQSIKIDIDLSIGGGAGVIIDAGYKAGAEFKLPNLK